MVQPIPLFDVADRMAGGFGDAHERRQDFAIIGLPPIKSSRNSEAAQTIRCARRQDGREPRQNYRFIPPSDAARRRAVADVTGAIRAAARGAGAALAGSPHRVMALFAASSPASEPSEPE